MSGAEDLEELSVLRNFIDFVNRQVGVYSDCLSGFQGNKVRVERQVARLNYPISRRLQKGGPIITWTSVEDPTRPDILHHRIIRADDFIEVNSEAGFNEQQVCWAIIVFLFAYWDEKIRPQIAQIRQVEVSTIQLDALGDLRILRNSIVHNGGLMTGIEHAKLKVLSSVCVPETKIALTHEQMHGVFVAVKNAIARLIMDCTHSEHLPGAPNPDEVVGLAISLQSGRKTEQEPTT